LVLPRGKAQGGKVVGRRFALPPTHGTTSYHEESDVMLNAIAGGFALDPADEQLLLEQRTITYNVNQSFIQIGAIYLKTSSKNPYTNDWYMKGYRDTNLQDWIDNEDARLLNVGFNLQSGWVDIDIDSGDSEYNRCILLGLAHVGIDTRFRFGRLSVGAPSHVMVQLSAEESPNFDYLKKFEPNAFRLKGQHFKTELRSFAANTDVKNLVKEAKQTVMPGSIYINKKNASLYDISVWYTSGNTVARSIRQIAETTPHRVTFNHIIRAIAFGTFLYILKPHWVEGSRQMAAQKMSGWLARVVGDSISMNNTEGLADSIYCPIDSDDVAESLIEFVCDALGDDEKHMRLRVFRDARKKIERNPDAHIPGWPSISQLFGDEATNALRTVFMPGADVSILTQMGERYIYDETDDKYIDRDRFQSAIAFVHDGTELDRRHRGDFVRIGGKLRPAFKLFEVSTIRKRVSTRDLYPDLNAGGIFRVDKAGDQLSDEQENGPGVITVFNTWRGWPVDLPQAVSTDTLNACVTALDRLLGYICRDNKKQMEWLKKWLAWTIRFPGLKQQVSPVIVGGQGVGKSFFGNVFLPAIFGTLWGSASPKVLDNVFAIEPFIGKMMVFIDEAKFSSEAATDEIKKLIRNVSVGGAEKFQSSRNHRIFARVVFASNRIDMNIGQVNVQDRALFYIKAYDKEFLNMDSNGFRTWTYGLKPFFDEYNVLLLRRDVREHYMHYFSTMEVGRHEIEDTGDSSANDSDIVASNMSWPRRVAKYIIEDGRIYEDADITLPFQIPDLNKRVNEVCLELGFRNVHGQRVLAEFKDAGLLEQHAENGRILWRFKYKLATLTETYGSHISVDMEPRFAFTDDDKGMNDTTLANPKPWKGTNARMFRKV
jgi:hypothetical protein